MLRLDVGQQFAAQALLQQGVLVVMGRCAAEGTGDGAVLRAVQLGEGLVNKGCPLQRNQMAAGDSAAVGAWPAAATGTRASCSANRWRWGLLSPARMPLLSICPSQPSASAQALMCNAGARVLPAPTGPCGWAAWACSWLKRCRVALGLAQSCCESSLKPRPLVPLANGGGR